MAQTLQQRFGANPGTDFASWSAWATVNRPNIVALVKAETTNTAAIRKRLETVNWLGGDAERGKKVYATANCAACHSGNLAIGPLLVGVGKRFGLDDLLTAVIDPNRDVSARYRTTRVTTTEGLSYTGIIVYEANDGILLQTSATDTVRVGGTKIESKTPLAQSLMPAGLLDNLAPGDVADLFAYLKRQ